MVSRLLLFPLLAALSQGAKLGPDFLRDPMLNRDMAVQTPERTELAIEGLLPSAVESPETQLRRLRLRFDELRSPIEKYIFLEELHNRSEDLFFRMLLSDVKNMMPLIYTPTVGKACLDYSKIWNRPRGVFLNKHMKSRIKNVLDNVPNEEVDVIVVTDGSRILGLGDLGANGMGIPVGKLSLYVAAAGIDPSKTLPITLDLGTNNEELLKDDLYIGARHERLSAEEFTEFTDEFVKAVGQRWPSNTPLIQWEDFSTENAFFLLERHRKAAQSFNDDIQGTGSVILAGLLAGLRLNIIEQKERTGLEGGAADASASEVSASLVDQRVVFLGAGSAAVGVADMMVLCGALGLVEEGKGGGESLEGLQEKLREKFYFLDSKGIVSKQSPKLAEHKKKYAQDLPHGMQLLEVIKEVKPTVLIGLSGQGGAFSKDIIKAFVENCPEEKRPLLFALSNPTANSECTATEAYRHGGERIVFASGSPFDPVTVAGPGFLGTGFVGEKLGSLGERLRLPMASAAKGKVRETGQGNNMYIFPGMGLAARQGELKTIDDELFVAAARSLAAQVDKDLLKEGVVYPRVDDIRSISAKVAADVIAWASEKDLSLKKLTAGEALKLVEGAQWSPDP
uniref:Malic enzyme n=1 Tax=Chromera velia CCMP2878 TaxID=1169474 RepID=A0A0G4I0N6_9ALVE|eukprot:Cvel_1621.t1-p1 / transcript=Cvel_1621.t1 / gene=Cvel_1621 / organism=Chromera_velia_CCMP2878 / gene_product=NADP-dependent malic enzyme, putative / transcript_product=NADP-dependent malic enzyme, putative / location=Cvel_scaffold58:18489-25340(-) / protein_length=622 / sequence_SO=supercontig / SO=protein_coding / is_pseudo=false